MVENKTLVGGLIAVIFMVIGAAYFYPIYTETDTCVLSGSYGTWENVTEKVYFNSSFPAIARYYCAKEAKITKEECLLQDKLINSDGCKWGGKVGGTTRLYVMVDPEVSISSESIKSYPLVDVGLQTSEGIKMDWLENGLTHKCLGFEITKGISINAVAGLILDTASKENAKPILSKKSINNWNETRQMNDKCNSIEITPDLNGTKIFIDNCTKKDIIITHSDEIWADVKIDSTELNKERLDGVKLQDGYYKYCFNVPIIKTAKGYGNSGEVKLILGSNIYTDRQHSSYWNASYTNQTLINVTVTETDTNQQIYINLSRNVNWKCAFVILNGTTEKELAWLNETREAFYTNFSVTSGQAEIIKIIHNATCAVSTPQYNYSQIMLLANEFETDADVDRVSSVDALNLTVGQKGNSVYLTTADGTAYTDHSWSISRWSNTSSVAYFYTLKSGTFNNCFLKLSTGTTVRAALGMINTSSIYWQYKTNPTERQSDTLIEQNVWTKFRFHLNSTLGVYIKEQREIWVGTTAEIPSNMSSIGWYYDTKAGDMFDTFFVYRDYGAKNPVLNIGSDQQIINLAPTLGSLNCTNATVYATSFKWNEPVINCQLTCTDDTSVSYVKFSGTEGVSAFDTTDTNDTWFANMTNFTGVGDYFSFTVPENANKMNYSGVWNVSAICSDGTLTSSSYIAWTVPNGNVNISLLYPDTNLSKKNGTYILNVQVRKGCTGGECFNMTPYFTIGV
ncbi:hypothetical protein M0R04_11245 [Candidatus Dojkabacteria bacterium]|jgi:hypothetical protein|nr:hypothetical protein [Candidatus Dojkabacteria bacterium]